MSNYDRQYGSLSEKFEFDGPAFKIKLPFENPSIYKVHRYRFTNSL